MKQTEVKVGDTVYCKIGSELCKCVVVAEVQDTKRVYSKYSGLAIDTRMVVRYRIRRDSEATPLPKLRTAAALRKENILFF